MLRVRRTRGIVVIITLVLVAFVGVVSGCSNNTTHQKLSELDENKLIQLLADNKIMIPANLETSVIRNTIADLEADSDRPAPDVNWTVFSDFYEELRCFVKEYYSMAP